MSNSPKPETRASLPGKLKQIDKMLWMRCFPQETVWPISLIVILIVAGVIVTVALGRHGTSVWLLFAAPALYLWRRVQKAGNLVRRHFRGGCICPAMVVSLNPPLVAVYSDLSKGEGEGWPVIKILHQPLDRIPGQHFRVGEQVAAVALYHNSPPHLPHWADFGPIVANCVTANPQELARMRAALAAEPESWGNLTHGLETVPKPYTPGLYWLRQH